MYKAGKYKQRRMRQDFRDVLWPWLLSDVISTKIACAGPNIGTVKP